MKKLSVLLLFLLVLSLPLFSQQDIGYLNNDLTILENLINDTIANTQEQQKLLEDLKLNLNESGNLIDSYEIIIAEREKSLKDLQFRLEKMSETYRTQSQSLAKYERKVKFLRNFTLIAVPVAAGLGVWAGWMCGNC